jgi:hypothetical protein
MEKVLPFFNKFPPGFQEAFIAVFGTEIRDERDIFIITYDFCDLKWEKINNGRVITLGDIYSIRGDGIILDPEPNEHHWPPKSVGGELTVSISMEFHIYWHKIFWNLHKKRELKKYLNILFHNKEVDDFKSFYKTADQVRKNEKTGRKIKTGF